MIGKLWFAFAVVVSVGAAYMYRYEPMSSSMMPELQVWDRWTQRVCIVGIRTDNKLICSEKDLNNLRQ